MAVSYISPLFSAADALGAPLVSGKLYTYLAGTTTPATTYSDAAGSSANANPIILNARGEAVVFLTAGTNYKFVLKTTLDVTIWTQDDIVGPLSSATLAASSGSSNVGFIQSGAGAAATTVQAELRQFLTPLQFGCAGDGVTDDSANFNEFLDEVVATGKVGDGLGLTYIVKNQKSLTCTKDFHLRNCSLISGSAYSNQFGFLVSGDVNYLLDNIRVDGARNTRALAGDEPWTQTSSLNGYGSIEPLGASGGRSFFKTSGAATAFTKTFTFRNCRITNLHCSVGLEVSTTGTVHIIGLTTKNLSYRNYAITHDSATNDGTTIVTNVDSRDTGILPANFLVDGVAKVRADAYAPQGSFNGLVSYGKYLVSNYHCINYGSCGITGDRNAIFNASAVYIENNDANAFSNNPSGAFWIENCTRTVADGIQIKITARDAREPALDSSGLQVFLGANAKAEISNFDINSTSANVKKGIRGSNQNDVTLKFSNGTVNNSGTSGIIIQNLASYANAAEITLNDVTCSGTLTVTDSALTKLNQCFISGITTLGANINTGGSVLIDGGRYAAALNIAGCNTKINIVGANMGGNFSVTQLLSSYTKRVVVDGCNISGVSTFNGCNHIDISGCVTERQLTFGDFSTLKVTGNTLKTDQGEAIFNLAPPTAGANLRGLLDGNAMWIKTGTVGAAYVNYTSNVTGYASSTSATSIIDTNNDKNTNAWTA